MCSKCRPHPAPMPALGKVVGEHTMLCKSSLHQKKKSQHKPVKKQPASQDASRAWRSGTLFDIMMWRKKSLEIGAGKPNSGLSFISGLCVTLDKSTYLLGSIRIWRCESTRWTPFPGPARSHPCVPRRPFPGWMPRGPLRVKARAEP